MSAILTRTVLVAILALGLIGCSKLKGPPFTYEVGEIAGPAPRLNTTPMAEALACLRNYRTPNLRLGVSDFIDGTGAMDGNSQNSRALSQRPDLMMTVALSEAGVNLVNRSSVNVAEWEMRNAIEKKLGDGAPVMIERQKIDFRPVRAGVFLGSTHYVTGAITELNWNIDSDVAEAGAFSVSAGKRVYRISIAVDVIVTNTETTQIVHAKSYKKQLVGFETNLGYFRFVDSSNLLTLAAIANNSIPKLELFNANIGEKQNEPVQTALRWLIELSAYDMVRRLTRQGAGCDDLITPSARDDRGRPGLQTISANDKLSAPVAPVATASAEAPTRTAEANSLISPPPPPPQMAQQQPMPMPAPPPPMGPQSQRGDTQGTMAGAVPAMAPPNNAAVKVLRVRPSGSTPVAENARPEPPAPAPEPQAARQPDRRSPSAQAPAAAPIPVADARDRAARDRAAAARRIDQRLFGNTAPPPPPEDEAPPPRASNQDRGTTGGDGPRRSESAAPADERRRTSDAHGKPAPGQRKQTASAQAANPVAPVSYGIRQGVARLTEHFATDYARSGTGTPEARPDAASGRAFQERFAGGDPSWQEGAGRTQSTPPPSAQVQQRFAATGQGQGSAAAQVEQRFVGESGSRSKSAGVMSSPLPAIKQRPAGANAPAPKVVRTVKPKKEQHKRLIATDEDSLPGSVPVLRSQLSQ